MISDYEWPYQSCSDKPLGLENKAVPDSALQSSPSSQGTLPSDARLGAARGWCAANVPDVYLKVDLGSPHSICAISTQGLFGGNVAYITTYKMELALKDFKGEYYKENGVIRVCHLTYIHVVLLYLPPPSRGIGGF